MISKRSKSLLKNMSCMVLFVLLTLSAVIDSIIEIQDEINLNNPRRISHESHLSFPSVGSLEVDFFTRVDGLSELLVKAYKIDQDVASKYAYWIVEDGDAYGIPHEMLSSLIMTESNFQDNAVSSKGAIGPGQIRMSIWGNACPMAGDSARLNVTCASMILSRYYAKQCRKSWDCALKMYNLGPSNYRDHKYRAAGARYLAKINKYIAVLNKHNG